LSIPASPGSAALDFQSRVAAIATLPIDCRAVDMILSFVHESTKKDAELEGFAESAEKWSYSNRGNSSEKENIGDDCVDQQG